MSWLAASSKKFQRGKMQTGTMPSSDMPIAIPICMSSATGSSMRLCAGRCSSVCDIVVPAQATPCPMNTTLSSADSSVIAAHSASKYSHPGSEADERANTDMRPRQVIGVGLDVREAVHPAPRFSGAGHHRLAVILDDEAHRQAVAGAVAA